MIVLDASVLIGFLFDQDPHHGTAVGLLRSAAAEPFGVSPVTLAVTLVVPTRLGRLSTAEQLFLDIGVGEIAFPKDAAKQLARLRVDTGLKMPDCCVLLAALTSRATVATFDDRLAQAAAGAGLATLTG